MKRKIIIPLLAISILASCTTSSPNNTTSSNNNVIESTTKTVTYKIEFDYEGINDQEITVPVGTGKKITKPTDPKKEYYEFDGWYTDSSLTNKFNFDEEVKSNLKLYPKFNFVGDDNYKYLSSIDAIDSFDDLGFVEGKIPDFSIYENTSSYVKVSTPDELINAIKNAKLEYTTSWDDTLNDNQGYFKQELKKDSTIKVIEITNDLNLGYNLLSNEAKTSGIVDNFSSKLQSKIDNNTLGIEMSDMFLENGISQIKFENISNLLIFSKNASKITHAGFKVTSSNNIVFKNLEFDELWQWEDSSKTNPSYTIGDYDVFGWAYFKIAFCGTVLIDHCTFGKSYDGQIDISNPDYVTNIYKYDSSGNVVIDKNGNKSSQYYTYVRAPYGANGLCEVHISNCNFKSGSDDQNGYLYKMMSKIEQSYQNGENKYLYYKTLRDNYNLSFEQILYGIAIPQKKGFLCGDREDRDEYNEKLYVSFNNCYFKNLEDRLPKVRGGFAWIYNSIIDSEDYYKIKNQIQIAKNISSINSKYKCALVSQGMVASNNADVLCHNVIFKGVESVLKNNENNTTAGYELKNIRFILNNTKVEGDNPSLGSFNASQSSLTTLNFDYHNKELIEFEKIDLDLLEERFKQEIYIGANEKFGAFMLYTKLNNYLDKLK